MGHFSQICDFFVAIITGSHFVDGIMTEKATNTDKIKTLEHKDQNDTSTHCSIKVLKNILKIILTIIRVQCGLTMYERKII